MTGIIIKRLAAAFLLSVPGLLSAQEVIVRSEAAGKIKGIEIVVGRRSYDDSIDDPEGL